VGLTGSQGVQGIQGIPGSPYNSRGTYNSGAVYSKFDHTNFNGASYYWASTNPGNSSPPSADWQLVSERGTQGLQGAQGLQGVGLQGIQGVPGSPYNARGTYNSGNIYTQFDHVNLNGASYYWANTASGNSLPPGANWQLVSDRGITGLQGSQGLPGIQGLTGFDGQSFNSRGLYSVIGVYAKYDYVTTTLGSSYVWTSSSNGNTIPPSSDWQLVAQVGAQGIQGIQGIQGTQGIQGQVGQSFNARGNYSSTTTYNLYDYVDYLGSSYWWSASISGINQAPPGTNWQLVALKGEPGSSGTVGSLSEGNKGDISVTDGGNTWTINNNSVELANIQEIATNRLLGRSTAGQGVVEQITIGAGLQVVNSVLSSSGVVYSQPDEPANAAPGTIWIDTDENVITGWQLISANYSVQAGDKLVIDCTNPLTLLLPPNPVSGTEFELTKYAGSSVVSIDTNGKKFNGVVPTNLRYTGSSFVIDTSDKLAYINNTIGWISTRKRVKPGVILAYVSNGDTNGLFYYLGTSGLTTTIYTNPIPGTIAAAASSIGAGTLSNLADRTTSEIYTSPTPNSWFAFNLGSRSMSISRYTLRSRSADALFMPRNWVLEGTNSVATFDIAGLNAATWTTIDARANDTTLTASIQYYTLIANGSTTPFQYLRIRSTGLDSSNNNYLILSEIEFYGTLSFD
jgi:hypothetical protein